LEMRIVRKPSVYGHFSRSVKSLLESMSLYTFKRDIRPLEVFEIKGKGVVAIQRGKSINQMKKGLTPSSELTHIGVIIPPKQTGQKPHYSPNKTASQVIRSLEMRIARLENKVATSDDDFLRPPVPGEDRFGKFVTCPICWKDVEEHKVMIGILYPGMQAHHAKGSNTPCVGKHYTTSELTSKQIAVGKVLNLHFQKTQEKGNKLKEDLKKGKIKARKAPYGHSMYLSKKNYPTIQDIINSIKFYQASYEGNTLYLNGESYKVVDSKSRWEIDPEDYTPLDKGREEIKFNGRSFFRQIL